MVANAQHGIERTITKDLTSGLCSFCIRQANLLFGMENVSSVWNHHILHRKQVLFFFRVNTATNWSRRLIHVYVTICYHLVKWFLFEEFNDQQLKKVLLADENLFWSGIERYVVWKQITICEARTPFLTYSRNSRERALKMSSLGVCLRELRPFLGQNLPH